MFKFDHTFLPIPFPLWPNELPLFQKATSILRDEPWLSIFPTLIPLHVLLAFSSRFLVVSSSIIGDCAESLRVFLWRLSGTFYDFSAPIEFLNTPLKSLHDLAQPTFQTSFFTSHPLHSSHIKNFMLLYPVSAPSIFFLVLLLSFLVPAPAWIDTHLTSLYLVSSTEPGTQLLLCK